MKLSNKQMKRIAKTIKGLGAKDIEYSDEELGVGDYAGDYNKGEDEYSGIDWSNPIDKAIFYIESVLSMGESGMGTEESQRQLQIALDALTHIPR